MKVLQISMAFKMLGEKVLVFGLLEFLKWVLL